MKHLAVLLFICFAYLTAWAQQTDQTNPDTLFKRSEHISTYFIAGVNRTWFRQSGFPGFETGIRINRNVVKHFSVVFDIFYSNQNMMYASNTNISHSSSHNTYEMMAGNLNFTLMPQFEMGKKAKFFLQAGPQVGAYIVGKAKVHSQSYNGLTGQNAESTGTTHGFVDFPIGMYQLGLCAGLGVKDISIGKKFLMLGVRATPLLLGQGKEHAYSGSVFAGLRFR